jgi:N-carbamoylputrescine amidase
MPEGSLTVALVSETFQDEEGPDRLAARLVEAASQGAQLAVLPELPLLPWCAAEREPTEDYAEPEHAFAWQALGAAAAKAGIALLGGVIIDGDSVRTRRNRAVLFGPDATVLGTYDKVHLPEEPGFWETSYYAPGNEMATPIDGLPMRVGIQICSDINRPVGCQLLGAAGCEAVLVPRATERNTYDRWRTVFIANAITTGMYVLSVNRPTAESGVDIGGPSIAVSPTGEVIAETEGCVAIVTLERAQVQAARKRYPGYLDYPGRQYVEAWRRLTHGP